MSCGAETLIRRPDHDSVVQRLKVIVGIRPPALEDNDCTAEHRQLSGQCDSGRPGPYNADVRLEARPRLELSRIQLHQASPTVVIPVRL